MDEELQGVLPSPEPARASQATVDHLVAVRRVRAWDWQVLQTVFNKLKIAKHIPVEKLCRGKYQDNLEWMQWMKVLWRLGAAGSHLSLEALCSTPSSRHRIGSDRRSASDESLRCSHVR